ncbi:cation transporter [Drepanopeziza brunnea f. sp. 'multigermtubi' MB_m1]|uniref:Cation transporter n=1 Tax=Marssonina brunnea f. sp. multigermtubi (strain MB_m1) TaxID=1072389 RepID=K1XQC1_MARBU|nr:cation transporter [Drepanopeziza brunnea f. sp. 'multigermtubi' MB_m1]EKD14774.1 cation transporter [Drepanopeziza brunnea f. sp. 'multigermtubi' MB_m1]
MTMLLYVCSIPHGSVSFVNCLYLAVTALTCTGMAPINLSTLNTAQQVLLGISFFIGSAPTVSLAVLEIRMRAFHTAFAARSKKKGSQEQGGTAGPESRPLVAGQVGGESFPGNDSEPMNHPTPEDTEKPLQSSSWRRAQQFLSKRTVGRNCAFHDLTREEQKSLFTVEIFGAISVAAYLAVYRADTCRENGANPISRDGRSTGIFISVAAFNNAGMSLLDQSMLADLPPNDHIAYGSLSLLPKTLHNTLRRHTKHAQIYSQLPPPCIYPYVSNEGNMLVAFEIFTQHDAEVMAVPRIDRIIDGVFQAFSVRCSGFTIVSIGALNSGLQSLYVGMMYVSAYPITIVMRNSNVYEERSLGIFSDNTPPVRGDSSGEEGDAPHTSSNSREDRLFFVKQQPPSQTTPIAAMATLNSSSPTVEALLGYDLWALVVAMTLIAFLENQKYEHDPLGYSLFNIIFEVFSAYATIGLSIGTPGQYYALSGSWTTVSKVIVIGLMLRGRHRSLPVDIDRAVQLPGEDDDGRHEEDGEEEQQRVREREGDREQVEK